MPNHVIIAVGGTGQVVLHYYVLLYLAGVIREPFDALVMDTDDLNNALQITRNFLNLLRLKEGPLGLREEPIATLEYMPLRVKGQAEVSQVLTGEFPGPQLHSHPASTWFAEEDLKQDISQGLFARPALSSVLTGRWLTEGFELPLRYDSNVVVLASLIGGTGGGLITPLVDRLRKLKEERSGVNISIRAVFFGEYFKPDKTGISRDRLLSNFKACLLSLKEQGVREQIDHFALIGDQQEKEFLTERYDNRERRSALPWPETDEHPFWRGTQAIAALLNEKTGGKVAFEKRGITGKEASQKAEALSRKGEYKRAVAREWVGRGTSRAQAVVTHKVVEHIAADPFASLAWPRHMVEVVAAFWSQAMRKLGEGKAADFPQQLQACAHGLWEGEAGLSKAFPEEFAKRKCGYGSFRKVDWPVVENLTVDPALFGSYDDALRRAAASLLFEALRSSENA